MSTNLETFDSQWSPDGGAIAVAGSRMIMPATDNAQVLAFSPDTGVDALAGAMFDLHNRHVSWASDGQFLAVGGGSAIPDNDHLAIMDFDEATSSLTLVASALSASDHAGSPMAWSPAGDVLVASTSPVYLLAFDRVAGSLTMLDNYTPPQAAQALAWSPSGQYVALVNAQTNPGSFGLTILSVAGGNILSQIDTFDLGGDGTAVAWSPDGTHLVVGVGGAGSLITLAFDGATLALVDVVDLGLAVNDVDWSADGATIVAAVGDVVGCALAFFDVSIGLLTELPSASIQTVFKPQSVHFHPGGAYVVVSESEEYALGQVAVYGVCVP